MASVVIQDNDNNTTSVTGSTQNLGFRIWPQENLVNGTVIIKLPVGITASADSDYGPSGKLLAEQISDGGQTITFTNLNYGKNGQIMVTLIGKTMPTAGIYTFEVYCDSDGYESGKLLSNPKLVEYTITES